MAISTGLKNPPAVIPKKKPGQLAKTASASFIDVLKTDHNFDIVKEIVEHMKMIHRAKKIKPQEKHRLLQNYYITLLSYCLPKIKIVEDNKDSGGKGVTFNINIGGTDPAATPVGVSKGRKGVSVSIPTVKQKDGSYAVAKPDD